MVWNTQKTGFEHFLKSHYLWSYEHFCVRSSIDLYWKLNFYLATKSLISNKPPSNSQESCIRPRYTTFNLMNPRHKMTYFFGSYKKIKKCSKWCETHRKQVLNIFWKVIICGVMSIFVSDLPLTCIGNWTFTWPQNH